MPQTIFSAAARTVIADQLAEQESGVLLEALRHQLQADDVVVELDAGLGLLTREIAKLSDGPIYAVETTELQEPLRAALREAGLSDRVSVVPELDRLRSLPRVDVVVTKATPGSLYQSRLWVDLDPVSDAPWAAGIRVVIPNRVDFVAVVVSAPELRSRALPWEEYDLGLNLACVTDEARRRPFPTEVDAGSLLSDPQRIYACDLCDEPSTPVFSTDVSLVPTADGSIDGIVIGYEVELSREHKLSLLPATDAPGMFLPLRNPLRCTRGVPLDVRILIDGPSGTWSVQPLAACDAAVTAPGELQSFSEEPLAWRARPYRLPIIRALLRHLERGVPTGQLLREIRQDLGVAESGDRRLLKQTVQWALTQGLAARNGTAPTLTPTPVPRRDLIDAPGD